MLSIRLCQALSKKISHDFAGIIGVIDNSVGLISSKDHQVQAIQLVQISTNKLIDRLRFYRHLYSNPSDSGKISILGISKLSINFLKLKNKTIKLIFSGLTNIKVYDSDSELCV